MIREDPITCKCGEIPQYPMPGYDGEVLTSLVVCSGHGASGVMEEIPGATVAFVLRSAFQQHRESPAPQGCEMLGAFFNVGTDREFGVDFTEDSEGTILWQRCSDDRILATNGENAMEGAKYHRSTSLREWLVCQLLNKAAEGK